MTPTLVLLDIDGVFSINAFKPVAGVSRFRDGNGNHPPAFPVPHAWDLIRWIDAQPHLHPCWISSWGVYSHFWNLWSKTKPWKVVYPLDDYGLELPYDLLHRSVDEGYLTKGQIGRLVQSCQIDLRPLVESLLGNPVFAGLKAEYSRESKVMAAMLEMREWDGRVIWVEDGGWDKREIEWAERAGVELFDTWARKPAGLHQGLDEELKELLSR